MRDACVFGLELHFANQTGKQSERNMRQFVTLGVRAVSESLPAALFPALVRLALFVDPQMARKRTSAGVVVLANRTHKQRLLCGREGMGCDGFALRHGPQASI